MSDAAKFLLGVVSDTHGQVEFTRQAVRMLSSFEVQVVLHCGDIGSTEIIPLFEALADAFRVRQLSTTTSSVCRTAIEAAGQTCHELFGSMVLAGVQIAFLHGDDTRPYCESRPSNGKWDLVCHGHTHVASQQWQVGPTLVLNPGALYRANPHSLAVVELPSLDVTAR